MESVVVAAGARHMGMQRLCFVAVIIAAFSMAAGAEKAVVVASPDKTVEVQLKLESLTYSVSMQGEPVLADSALGLEMKGQSPMTGWALLHEERHAIDRTWKPVWGKASQIRDHYSELTLQLQERAGLRRRMDLIVRAYPDGIALRYSLPQQPGLEHSVVTKELTSFHFPSDATVWAGTTSTYHHSFEHEYVKQRISAIPATSHVILPMLTEISPTLYAAVAEADLKDWAGMYLMTAGPATMSTDLSPRLDGAGLVRADTPHLSPWRVLLLGQTPGDLIESNLIENLNPPSKISDTSWIKPGKMAWDHWWSGDVQMDNETNRRFITFASEMGFPYQLIDWQWYGPFDKPEAKITQPAPQIDMPRLLRFAAEHHVREWIWIHSGDVNRAKQAGTLDSAFATYESWGIAGVKIDFMDSNDQAMVNWYEDVVSLAARHRLMVDFHGAYEPTGLRVTYPNLLTREGVLGNEYNKFSNRVTPLHKVTLPFTRMLAGPMDYTPGGFLNRSPSEWKQTLPTEVMGSRAQELALFVVYWSPLTCVTDDPANYKDQPGLDFLRVVPTMWDETKVLEGTVGEHIVMARRQGQNWYVGGMTGEKAYDYRLPLSFLAKGEYVAHIYADPKDAGASYEALAESTQRVTANDSLDLHMRLAGGVAIYIEPAKSQTASTAPATVAESAGK
jgi:alpha-glucosidase